MNINSNTPGPQEKAPDRIAAIRGLWGVETSYCKALPVPKMPSAQGHILASGEIVTDHTAATVLGQTDAR